MNDMSRPDGVAGGVSTVEPEPARCWSCMRERPAADDEWIIWAEANCKNWEYCPCNFGQPQ